VPNPISATSVVVLLVVLAIVMVLWLIFSAVLFFRGPGQSRRDHPRHGRMVPVPMASADKEVDVGTVPGPVPGDRPPALARLSLACRRARAFAAAFSYFSTAARSLQLVVTGWPAER
jgi:hypothetical protein